MTVNMIHPDVEQVAQSTDEAFLQVWRPRGWERVDEPAYHASVTLGHKVAKVEDLTIEELIQLGAPRGGAEVARSAKKQAHIDAYVATFTPASDPLEGVPVPEGATIVDGTAVVSENPDADNPTGDPAGDKPKK